MNNASNSVCPQGWQSYDPFMGDYSMRCDVPEMLISIPAWINLYGGAVDCVLFTFASGFLAYQGKTWTHDFALVFGFAVALAAAWIPNGLDRATHLSEFPFAVSHAVGNFCVWNVAVSNFFFSDLIVSRLKVVLSLAPHKVIAVRRICVYSVPFYQIGGLLWATGSLTVSAGSRYFVRRTAY